MASKVFIVTGASKGIGAAITKYLLGQSHQVVLAARSQEQLEAFKKSNPEQVEFVAGDMVDSEMPSKLTELAVKCFGKIDGIIINHGSLVCKSFGDSTLEEWKQVYDVNFFSGIALAHAGLPELRKSKGCLLWTSSGAASKCYKGWSLYGATKAAMAAVSGHIGLEEPDITSVSIAPGRVDTDMQVIVRSAGKDTMDKAQYQAFVDAFDQGTLLKPEQPGNVMARFVANPNKKLSGKAFTWNSPELADYQE